MITAKKIGKAGTWWPADEQGFLWADNGGTVLQNAATQELAEQYVRFYEQEGLFWCIGHDRWEAKPHAFRRFAGLYCEETAKVYKANNERACQICSQPIWNCFC